MKSAEIKSLSINELNEKIATEKSVYANLKFSHAISPIENPMQIRKQRKLVARLITELNDKSKAE